MSHLKENFGCRFGVGFRSSSGFTLIELLVAMALSMFLIGGLLLTYLSGRSAALESETLSRMQENIRFASDYLVRDVRNAGFRDHLTLTMNQYRLIGEQFARYGADNSELIIRYAGRGSCGNVFGDEELKVIENLYFVNNNGDLVCIGNELAPDGSVEHTRTVVLVTGLDGIEFQFLYAPGANPADPGVCDFFDNDVVDDACIGVRMELAFTDEETRVARINAAFRNVIVDRIYRRDGS
jgi:hypothetical protein